MDWDTVRDGRNWVMQRICVFCGSSPGGNPTYTELATALTKLYRDNANTLTPDALHSAFYDSHPPAAARIEARCSSASMW